jgi:hypothetical protein
VTPASDGDRLPTRRFGKQIGGLLIRGSQVRILRDASNFLQIAVFRRS